MTTLKERYDAQLQQLVTYEQVAAWVKQKAIEDPMASVGIPEDDTSCLVVFYCRENLSAIVDITVDYEEGDNSQLVNIMYTESEEYKTHCCKIADKRLWQAIKEFDECYPDTNDGLSAQQAVKIFFDTGEDNS